MISIILKYTLRNLIKNKFYHLISICGLAIAIASALFIMICVNFELSFDRFHRYSERIYRFTIETNWGNDQVHFARISDPRVLQMPAFYPEIEEMIRLHSMRNARVRINDDRFFCDRFFSVDSNFFEVFDYKLIAGDPKEVLRNPKSLVISKSLAENYFGDTNPIGQVIYTSHQSDTTEYLYTVTGIMEDFPSNSHFHSEILGSFDNPAEDVGWAYYYFLLKENVDPENLIEKYPGFLGQFMPEEFVSNYIPHLQPITDIHLYSEKSRELEQNGSVTRVYIFGIVGLALLIIAFINYANLYSVAMKKKLAFFFLNKVAGARIQDIAMFTGFETLLNCFIAFLIALFLVFSGIPVLNKVFTYELKINESSILMQTVILGLILLFVGFLVGMFPVLLFGIKEKISLLTGNILHKSSDQMYPAGKKIPARKIMVILQFCASITIIICTIILYQQVNYMLKAGIGGNRKNIIVLKNLPAPVREKYRLFKTTLLENPLIVEVTASMEEPSYETMDAMSFEMSGMEESLKGKLLPVLPVDYNFLDFFNIFIVAGTDFPEYSESRHQDDYIINEKAVKFLGYNSPDEVVGKSFKLSHPYHDFYGGKIIGVTEDFHTYTLSKEIKPMIMFQVPVWYFCFLIEVEENNMAEALDYIRYTWAHFYPDYPFAYDFLDELYSNLYKRDISQFRVLGIFSFLTIVIACLGLVGVMMYSTELRTKEIGIRKVNGATIFQIIFLLNKELMIMVSIAFLLAIPVSIYFLNKWMSNFSYKIDISWTIFLFVFIATFFILILSVSYLSFHAASRNPSEVLKYE